MVTDKQKEVLRFILGYQTEKSHSPTMDEIANAIGKSTSAIRVRVYALIGKRMIRHDIAKQRHWEVTPLGEEAINDS